MSKPSTMPHNLKQLSPDNQGLKQGVNKTMEKQKPAKINEQAAEMNRDISRLQEAQFKKSDSTTKPK